MTGSKSINRQRWLALDGLRGLAILMVVLFHCLPTTGIYPVDVVLHLRRSLWVGVDLFFVLSGFLITGILMDSRGAPRRWRTFFWRRTLRIFPLYYFSISIVFVVLSHTALFASKVENTADPGWFYAYAFNIFLSIRGSWPDSDLMNHFWSLAVEEQFYLVWPLFVFALRNKHLPTLMFLTVVSAQLFKLILWDQGVAVAQTATIARIDTFALGALVAYAYRHWNNERLARFARISLLMAAVILLVLAFPQRGLKFVTAGSYTLGTLALAIFFASAVAICVAAPRARLTMYLQNPSLRWLGRYSYGIYVYHWLVFRTLTSEAPGRGLDRWLVFAATVLLTIGAAFLSYHAIEKRFLLLKDRQLQASGSTS